MVVAVTAGEPESVGFIVFGEVQADGLSADLARRSGNAFGFSDCTC